MSINLDVKLRKADKIYHVGENVAGLIILETNSDVKHDGITLTIEGSVNLQVSSKNVGILEAFYNAIKPIQLLSVSCEVSGPGRVPAGRTEIPFEMPLQARPNKTLYETYHGVFVNISYNLHCDIRRSFLSKDLQKNQQFLIQYRPRPLEAPRVVTFAISPESLVAGAGAPSFLLRGKFDSTRCSVSKPLTGFVVMERCEIQVRSIELQLVRVETCGCAEGYAKDATEIQNIQIGDGDIPHNIEIPIYMIFPRLFTCPTLITPNFKIEFEINIVVVFQNDHLVTENFPILLTREE